MNLYEKLTKIQNEAKVSKDLYNDFGKYNYRSAETIFEMVKPLCEKYGVTLSVTDDISYKGDRYYVIAFATIVDHADPDSKITVSASAREAETKKGMDDAQVTGACSSYARKYALGGLFCLDDNKDPDTNEHAEQLEKAQAKEDKEVKKLQEKAFSLAVNLGYKDDAEAYHKMSSKENANYFKVTPNELKAFVHAMEKKINEKQEK